MVEEASALEGDEGGTDKEGLAGRLGVHEEIIGGDGVLVTGAAELVGSATDGDDHSAGGEGVLLAKDIRGLNGVLVDNTSEHVVVGNVLGEKGRAGGVVQASNVVLDVVDEGLPVMVDVGDVPTEGLGVFHEFTDDSSLVHELLGDATDVDASTSETPNGALGGGLDEIEKSNVRSKVSGFFGASHTYSKRGDRGRWRRRRGGRERRFGGQIEDRRGKQRTYHQIHHR